MLRISWFTSLTKSIIAHFLFCFIFKIRVMWWKKAICISFPSVFPIAELRVNYYDSTYYGAVLPENLIVILKIRKVFPFR